MLTFFIFISILSVAAAVAMAFVLARVLRADRRRSDARSTALSQMAMADFLPEPDTLEEPAVGPVQTSDDLFQEAASESRWSPRLAVAGVGAVVLIAAFGIASTRTTPSTGGAANRQAEAAAPLQLTALDHSQSGGTLTVAGRVKNPAGAQPVANLTATVFLFGQDGSFMTSGRSPLDVTTLDGGVESAFAVAIPVNGVVARYRVSFRDSSGHPVAHVDSRQAAAVARKE